MLFRRIRDWLLPRSGSQMRRRQARPAARCPRFSRAYHPSLDPLEDRRLLTASLPQFAPALVASPSVDSSAQVVGRNIFYNNSQFDGNDPHANAADDNAIATDKRALLVGQTATFANYTSYRGGINGIMIDIAGLPGVPNASDFVFTVGASNDPSTWTTAPQPSSLTVRPGAGANGSTRVTITWPDGVIAREWLQVDVRATSNTGLRQPNSFFFGNAPGEAGNSVDNAAVTAMDPLLAGVNRARATDPVSITSSYDFNRDGLVNTTDERIARDALAEEFGALPLIAPRTDFIWADVVGKQLFYNHSQFDGDDPAANANDDAAIATDKVALAAGGTASFANYSSYSRGINGIMVDVVGLTQTPTVDDFEFRVGNDSDPNGWRTAPAPSSISLRVGAGVNGSSRVTIVWPDNAIQRQWLQVTVKSTSHLRLAANDMFYFGNVAGETGDATANAVVGIWDRMQTHFAVSAKPVAITSPFDFNRDHVVNGDDEMLAVANQSDAAHALQLIQPPLVNPAAAAPATPVQPAYTDFVSANVVARRIFYNNSHFDGNQAAANARDDQAVAADKSALLPGGTASFANYTSYSRGINGIQIDIAGLPDVPTADDFLFKVGDTADPSQWSDAPAPLGITVRPGAGVSGSARITITWPDNWIQNAWLQVTVKATPRTGLRTPDVFYFGNRIGEAGNSPGFASVTAMDQTMTAIFAGRAANLASKYDYNRDGWVDATDVAITRNSTATGSLPLLTVPSLPATTPAQVDTTPLFNQGDGGINITYSPNLVTARDGSVLAIAEGRWARGDSSSYSLVMRRSTDNGVSWSPISTIVSIPSDSGPSLHNGSAVVDITTGQIFLLYTNVNSQVLVISSDDNGLTWSAPAEITASVKVTADGNPNPSAFPSTPWGWYATGPGHGIQIQNGPYAGRLVIASDHRLTSDISGNSWSHIVYSDDHGLSWHLGGGVDQTNTDNDFSNEATVVEQSDGGLYMSIRLNRVNPGRGYSRSYDGGNTWSTVQVDPQLYISPVEGSLLRINARTVLFSAPGNSSDTRSKLTIWVSFDNMQTWAASKTLFFNYSGYSDMTLVGPDTVLIAYNAGQVDRRFADNISLARVNLRSLLGGDPPQFSWYFNEQAPGQAANLLGPSIRDSSVWNNQAQAQAASPAEAPLYVAGRNANDAALRLTKGSDLVQLAPPATDTFRFYPGESFTFEIVMRTTDTSGVIVGTASNVYGWTLKLADGFAQFDVTDRLHGSRVSSDTRINDGNWHHVVVQRDMTTLRLRMYVDGVATSATPLDLTGILPGGRAVTLGGYNDGTEQLALDVDAVRLTRGVLAPSKFLPASFVAPPPVAAPVYGPDAPNAIPGLKFWLPANDRTHYFSDMGYTDPLPTAPVFGTAAHSAIDASDSKFRVSAIGDTREVTYTDDPQVGPNWIHSAAISGAPSAWVVHDSNGASANNFDFVQNTGVFTISTFVKAGATPQGSGSMTLFDTSQGTAANNGFSLVLMDNGALNLNISGPNATSRFGETTAPLVARDTWYHVAAVGRGPGQPVEYYVTAVSDTTVRNYLSTSNISGVNGNYRTDINHDLNIGGRSNDGQTAFNGQLVDEAIYNRPLSATEIQQLFDYTKKV